MDFAEAFAAIRPVLAKTSLAAVLAPTAIVTSRDGELLASDGIMSVVVPFDCGVEFAVVGADLARAVSILTGDVTWRATVASLIVKSGSARFTLPLSPVVADRPSISGISVVVPGDFAEKLQKAALFMSTDKTKRWACGVRIHNGQLFATNNVSLIAVDCDIYGDVALPDYLVQYILQRGNPSTLIIGDTAVQACWAGGGHIVAALSEPMPDSVVSMAASAGYATNAISDAWRDAFDAAASVGHDVMTISSTQITVNTCGHVFEADVASCTTVETTWDPKFLRNVIDVATHFDPSTFPAPARFHGVDCRGLVIGRK